MNGRIPHNWKKDVKMNRIAIASTQAQSNVTVYDVASALRLIRFLKFLNPGMGCRPSRRYAVPDFLESV